MNSVVQQPSVQPAAPGGPLPIDTAALIDRGRREWAHWIGGLISIGILAAVLWQWRQLGEAPLGSLVPASPIFWLAFLAYYLAAPIAEWIIFRRLWRLPIAGLVPLLRKKVSNELLLGYVGEVYFYSWARRQSHITTAPFGAIKDVAILSAVAGNLVALLLLLGAPLVTGLLTEVDLSLSARALAISVAFVSVTSMAVLFLRRHVLSLPPRELAFVMAVHVVRIALSIGVLALMWHLALPGVPLLWWFLLSLLRQIVSRLPFVPNKDVVFAGVAIFLVGEDGQIAALMALIAGAVLIAHLVVGATLALAEFGTRAATRADGAGARAA